MSQSQPLTDREDGSENEDIFNDSGSWEEKDDKRSGNSDVDEDEWTQTNRKKKDASGVYFLGTQPVVEEIEPSSELVKRSIDIARRASTRLNSSRTQRVELHESLDASNHSANHGAINASVASSSILRTSSQDFTM